MFPTWRFLLGGYLTRTLVTTNLVLLFVLLFVLTLGPHVLRALKKSCVESFLTKDAKVIANALSLGVPLKPSLGSQRHSPPMVLEGALPLDVDQAWLGHQPQATVEPRHVQTQ